MNKTIAILASLAVMGSAAECMAATAAVVNFNNYDQSATGFPIMYQSAVGAAIVTAPDNAYVELLAGPVGGTLAPVTIAGSFQGLDGGGLFDKGTAVIPGVAAGAQADFQLRAWVNATSYDTATLSAITARWSQATGSWVSDASPPATAPSIPLNMPNGVTIGPAVPEPATIALGLLGAAALLIRRRK